MNKSAASQLRSAVSAHRRGDLHQAATRYQRLLRKNPKNPDALHLLALTLADSGQLAAAVALLGHAISIAGPQPGYCANLGRLFMRQGRYTHAAACFRQSLQAAPLDPGVTLQLGKALAASGELEWARTAFEQAIALDPTSAEACFDLAVLYTVDRRFDDARRLYERALQLEPRFAGAHNNLAILMHTASEWETALHHYRESLALDPANDDTRYNYGRALEEAGQPGQALAAFHDLLSRTPGHLAARSNAGNCLLALGQPHDAIQEYRSVIATDPDHAEAHWNLSLALLQTGQFAEGWREYDWRFRQWPDSDRRFSQPRWRGDPLEGRRILLHSEQGLGDTLQFARYAWIAKQRGGRVLLECQPALVRLMLGLRGVDEVLERGRPLPPFDCHCPLMTLPGVVQTDLGSIPAGVPYISPPADLVSLWSDRIGADRSRLRIGIAWAGNPCHRNDKNRSLPSGLLPRIDPENRAAWHSLQVGAPPGARPGMVDLAAGFTDFADTAAAIEHLDLIVTVDTAVAHLAGALARPVWTLLPYAADWRWLRDRSDSPWYPSMRLFRQPAPQDWSSVIDLLNEEIARL